MAAVDPHAQLPGPLLQQGLRAELGQEQGVPVAGVQCPEVQPGVQGREVPARHGAARGEEARGEPAHVQHLHAARVQRQGPGMR